MTDGRTAPRLAMVVVVGLVWVIVSASAAHSQNGDDAATINAEVVRLFQAGKYAEATEMAKQSLAIVEKSLGAEHPHVGVSLSNLASLYQVQGRYAEAAALYQRSLSIREKVLGPEHPDVAMALNNLALLYEGQGRYADAEALYQRSLSIREKVLGPEHPQVGVSLNNLAAVYQGQGRYAVAERHLKRSLTILEKARGPEHPDVATALSNLAVLYGLQGRYAEAEPLYTRELANREKALGAEHPSTSISLHNLAELYRSQGRYAEAEALYQRSLSIREKVLGPEHPDVAIGLSSLAVLYQHTGRYVEAEPLQKRDLAVREKALGPEHPGVAVSLSNLAITYLAQGRYAEAEPLMKRSLAIRQKALGSEHPDVGLSFNNLAVLAFEQEDWSGAADYWRSSTAVIRRRTERDLGGALGREAQRLSWMFWGLVKTAHRLAAKDASSKAMLAIEMFETAQWAQGSEAASSLTQMAARSAKDSPEIAGLVRERQDLVGQWQATDKVFIAAKSEPPTRRKADAEKALADRLNAIDTRLAEIDHRFARDFPDYAALASPTPLSIKEVQSQLGANEALVLFLDTPELKPVPEETFVWVVTKGAVDWVRSELGTARLSHEVAALRCGLDATAWDGDGAEKCAGALAIPLNKAPGPNQQLPFDHSRAHKLYSALFGEVQDLVRGKHLLIVPSGPLTQLPFQVLVTKQPTSDDHRTIAWLARDHPITMLPAVSSFKALRRVGKPSPSKPMIGFGNPLLDGPDARYAGRAKLAREKQRCPAGSLRVAALTGLRGGVQRVETRSGLADVSHIKMQAPSTRDRR